MNGIRTQAAFSAEATTSQNESFCRARTHVQVFSQCGRSMQALPSTRKSPRDLLTAADAYQSVARLTATTGAGCVTTRSDQQQPTEPHKMRCRVAHTSVSHISHIGIIIHNDRLSRCPLVLDRAEGRLMADSSNVQQYSQYSCINPIPGLRSRIYITNFAVAVADMYLCNEVPAGF